MNPGDRQDRPSTMHGDTFRIDVPLADGKVKRITVRGTPSDVTSSVRRTIMAAAGPKVDDRALMNALDDIDEGLRRGCSFSVPFGSGRVSVDRSARKPS